MLRIVIADDEAPARNALRRALDTVNHVEIVGEAANGADAIALVKSLEPDLLFLDIRMPGMTGLEVAATLRRGRGPAVVFVTAYNTHAIEAFDQAALDYLLKPISQDRVAESIRRVRGEGAPKLEEIQTKVIEHLSAGKKDASLLRVGGRLQQVEHAAVHYLEAAGNYVRVHGENDTWLVRGTIASVMETLGDQFVRIHRSFAVRIDEITEVSRPDGNDPSARLKSGHQVPIGRTYWKALRERLES